MPRSSFATTLAFVTIGLALLAGMATAGLAVAQTLPPGFIVCKRTGEGAWGCWSPMTCCISECCAPGRRCTPNGCEKASTVGKPLPPPRSPALKPPPPAQSPGPVPPVRAAYECVVCGDKLKADVRTGWASGNLRAHVESAIADYENCKLKAIGECLEGDLYVRTLRSCGQVFPPGDEVGYRSCIAQSTTQ